MKTHQLNKPRYRLAIEEQNRQAGMLQQLARMGSEEFYTLEFNAGLELLQSYWKDMDYPMIPQWKEQLATDPGMGYWRWFINYKRQEDALFLNDYRPVHQDNLADYGSEEAARMLYEEYLIHLRALANCQHSHNRMYHFITQLNTLQV